GDKPAKQAYLTVLEAAPFSIAAGTLFADFEQNQSGRIDVLAERRNGFTGTLKITAEAFSPARDSMGKSFEFQPLILKAGENTGTLTLRAKTEAEVGARPIILKAESEWNGVTVTDYSRPVPVATGAIPFVLSPSLTKL